MQDADHLYPLLEDTARTGVRVVGPRLISYAVGFAASIMIARALGPTGRGIYALPTVLLGVVAVLDNLGVEHANVFLGGRGVSLRTVWTHSTPASLLASLAVWALVAGAHAIGGRRLFGGLPALWIAIPILQVPLLRCVSRPKQDSPRLCCPCSSSGWRP